MMRFSVPTNFQKDLIPNLDKGNIEELYGKLDKDIIGGGRASSSIPFVAKKALLSHINTAHKHGLKFNYLLNASCIDNLEFTSSWQRKFYRFLNYLVKIGVDKVTVGTPYLLEIIKKRYPELKVSVSVHAGIETLQRAKFWQDLGADEMTLYTDINRNFALLEKIRKEIDCSLRLIANVTCLYGCPFYHSHANLQSHASQSRHVSKGFVIDYCTLRCRLIRLTDPQEFIKSRWIRPEDVTIYEKLGIDSLKFADRGMKTEFILRIVKAYTERKYDGNLLDLFNDPSKSLAGNHSYLRKAKYFLRPFRVNIFKLYKAKELTGADKIYIDNQALNGFLNYFIDKSCDSCRECDYCKETAEKVVKIPIDFKKIYSKNCKNLLDSIIDGGLFKWVK